jgi:NAD-dependent dihydropyrimidine dehydrogenase PreA subunit
MSRIEVVIDEDRCDGDGQCVEGCPNSALVLKDGKAVVVDPERCGECYYCESICPNDAIHVRRVDE